MTIEDFPPRPRHCTIKKWSDFDGYGFNLHAEKNKPGQFIGKVDPYSPSEAAGLKEFDKIIEVNGVNISQENHKQVVQRIKADPNQTSLLVLDAHTEAHFKEKGIIVTGQLSCVHYMTSDKADKDFEEIDTRMQVPSPKYGRDSPDSDIVRNDHSSDVRMKIGREDSLNSERTLSNRSSVSSTQSPSSFSSGSPRSTPSPINSGVSPHRDERPGSVRREEEISRNREGGLDLPLTAKEMRERIVSKKKRDPRRDDRMDFRKKYEIIQTL